MKVRVATVFDADQAAIFEKLQQVATLQFICRPLARFEPMDALPVWQPGKTFRLHLRAAGIDFGVHTIEVERFDREGIFTRERNKFVPVWNHRISLEALADGRTRYTDEVELHAGVMTVVVWAWANVFYRHRQKRWRGLLRG
jgi:hypothetical protein